MDLCTCTRSVGHTRAQGRGPPLQKQSDENRRASPPQANDAVIATAEIIARHFWRRRCGLLACSLTRWQQTG
eukprot:595774-Pyramimonas_sp.AAC.1